MILCSEKLRSIPAILLYSYCLIKNILTCKFGIANAFDVNGFVPKKRIGYGIRVTNTLLYYMNLQDSWIIGNLQSYSWYYLVYCLGTLTAS
jgi:hypothetical protein